MGRAVRTVRRVSTNIATMRIVASGVVHGVTASAVRIVPPASIVTARATISASGAAQNQTAPAVPTARQAGMRSNMRL